MSKGGRMPLPGKIILIVIALVGLYFGLTKTGLLDKIAPKGNTGAVVQKGIFGGGDKEILRVTVNTWPEFGPVST